MEANYLGTLSDRKFGLGAYLLVALALPNPISKDVPVLAHGPAFSLVFY